MNKVIFLSLLLFSTYGYVVAQKPPLKIFKNQPTSKTKAVFDEKGVNVTFQRDTIFLRNLDEIILYESSLYLNSDSLFQKSKIDSGAKFLSKSVELKIFNKEEVEFILTGVKLYGADILENELKANADKDIYGDMHEIVPLEKSYHLFNSSSVQLFYRYEIADFLSQPFFDDCDCEVSGRINLEMSVDRNSNLIVNYNIYPGGIGVKCPWCPIHTLYANIILLFKALEGKPLLDKTINLFDQSGFKTRLNNFIGDITKKVTIANRFFSVDIYELNISYVRFSSDGLFVTINYNIEIK